MLTGPTGGEYRRLSPAVSRKVEAVRGLVPPNQTLPASTKAGREEAYCRGTRISAFRISWKFPPIGAPSAPSGPSVSWLESAHRRPSAREESLLDRDLGGYPVGEDDAPPRAERAREFRRTTGR